MVYITVLLASLFCFSGSAWANREPNQADPGFGGQSSESAAHHRQTEHQPGEDRGGGPSV